MGNRYKTLWQKMYTAVHMTLWVIHAFLGCQFKCDFVTCQTPKHTIRIKLKINVKYVFLFDKLWNRKKLHVFQIRIPLYYRGGVKYSFHDAFLRLICLLTKYFILFYCLISVHRYKHTFKGKYFFWKNSKGELHACFLTLSYYHYAT